MVVAGRRGALEAGDAAAGASHRLRHQPRDGGDADGAGGGGAARHRQARHRAARAARRRHASSWSARAPPAGACRRRWSTTRGELDLEALDRAHRSAGARRRSRGARRRRVGRVRHQERAAARRDLHACPTSGGRGWPTIATTRSTCSSPTGWWRWRCSARPSAALVGVEELRAAHAHAVAPAQARVHLSRRRDLRGHLRRDAGRAEGGRAHRRGDARRAPGAGRSAAAGAARRAGDRLRRVLLGRGARARDADRADERQGSGAAHPRSRREAVLHRRGAAARGVRARELHERASRTSRSAASSSRRTRS